MKLDQLEDSKEFLHLLFANMDSAILILDEELRINDFNKTFQNIFSRQPEELLGALCGNGINCVYAVEANRPCGSMAICLKCELRQTVEKTLCHQNDTLHDSFQHTYFIKGQKKEKFFHIHVKSIEYQKEKVAMIMIQDMTELEEKNRKLQQLVERDGLTGLLNHKYILQYLKDRLGQEECILGMFDIDHFKCVNDNHGHLTGDEVLIKTAEILADDKKRVAGRYGGEEFLVIWPNNSFEEALKDAEDLRKRIAKEKFSEAGFSITISGGVRAKEKDLEIFKAIDEADNLLYKAKNSGRNQICF